MGDPVLVAVWYEPFRRWHGRMRSTLRIAERTPVAHGFVERELATVVTAPNPGRVSTFIASSGEPVASPAIVDPLTDPRQAAIAKIAAAHRNAVGLPLELAAEVVARETAVAVADLVEDVPSRSRRAPS